MPANVKKSYFTSNSAISPDPEYNAASAENILLQIIQPNSSRRILHLNILIENSRMFKCKTNFSYICCIFHFCFKFANSEIMTLCHSLWLFLIWKRSALVAIWIPPCLINSVYYSPFIFIKKIKKIFWEVCEQGSGKMCVTVARKCRKMPKPPGL